LDLRPPVFGDSGAPPPDLSSPDDRSVLPDAFSPDFAKRDVTGTDVFASDLVKDDRAGTDLPARDSSAPDAIGRACESLKKLAERDLLIKARTNEVP
jgi:hypothetical protein